MLSEQAKIFMIEEITKEIILQLMEEKGMNRLKGSLPI